MTTYVYNTRTEALRQARALRDQGAECKIFRRAGTYTQPGRGIVSFVEYRVEVLP